MNNKLNKFLRTIAARPRFRWRSYGLVFLVIPLIILSITTASLGKSYTAFSAKLEDKSAKVPEIKTRIAAHILDKIIGEIQDRTDALARRVSNLDLKKPLDKAYKRQMVNWSAGLVRLSITCTLPALKDWNTLSEREASTAIAKSVVCKNHWSDAPDSADNPKADETIQGNTFSVSIYGSAIAFAKHNINKGGRVRPGINANRWATYSHRSPNGIDKDVSLPNEDYADSSNDNTEWYYRPVNEKRNMWSRPYLDKWGDTYMVTYSSLVNSGGKPVGVVTADVSIDQLKKIIEELIRGYDGFGALTNGAGVYLYHPERNYVKAGKTVLDVAREKKDKDRYLVDKLIRAGKGRRISHVSTTTGEASWLIVEPIKSSGWSIQNTFFKDSFYSTQDSDHQRHLEIKFTTALIFFIACVIAVVINLFGWGRFSVWGFSIALSVMLAWGIWNTWDLALNHTKPKNSNSPVIDSLQSIEWEKAKYLASLNGTLKGDEKLLTIPTGIYIETMDLKSTNNVNISGRVWQVFRNTCGCHASCDPGVMRRKLINLGGEGGNLSGNDRCCCQCPQMDLDIKESGVQFGSAKNVKLTALPDETNENCDTIKSWWFQADIVTKFDYSRYPLEVEYVDIHLVPKSVKTNVIIVPDVESYKFGSNRKAGLNANIFVPGWDVFRSYFTLAKPDKSRPTFGMEDHFDKKEFPELHFRIGLKRVFVDAFISNLTPLIVSAIILFSVALLPATIDISRVLGICVSVFFVVVFAHMAIRRSISTGEIFYLEYFYFAIYFALLLVPLNAFRQTLGIRSAVLEYKNGLIYKVLFWPSLLSIFYLVTIIKFY